MSFEISQYKKLGSLIVVSGASGTGKSSILKPVIAEDCNLDFSVSCTTRKPRPGERDSVDYYFIDVDKFQKLIEEDAFIEHANVHGNYYGTLKSEVEGALQQGKDVLLDIDIQGALSIRKNFSKETLIGRLAEFVFIMPPSYEELERRLRGRGTESEESLKKRLLNAREEMNHFLEYDYCILNSDLYKAIGNFKSIIESFRCKTRSFISK
ncbi:MAG TPA: guanylate kinase [Lentisphaeria bacterium]|nr:MAG: guanylate kinase [Lentisphaerae bacterium GWF2_38_69]HBM15012.1 guanylate kinase [Lentisphaeria bacterium]